MTGVHWWGSYVNWRELSPAFSPAGLRFEIYTDVPADPNNPDSYSHPGDLLWDYAATVYKAAALLTGLVGLAGLAVRKRR